MLEPSKFNKDDDYPVNISNFREYCTATFLHLCSSLAVLF